MVIVKMEMCKINYLEKLCTELKGLTKLIKTKIKNAKLTNLVQN
jgi:hypothetical protein